LQARGSRLAKLPLGHVSQERTGSIGFTASRLANRPALVDDCLVNGGLVGLGVGFVAAGLLTSSCGLRKCTPFIGHRVHGGQRRAGWPRPARGVPHRLIDKARRDPPPVAVALRAARQMRAVRIDWRLGKAAPQAARATSSTFSCVPRCPLQHGRAWEAAECPERDSGSSPSDGSCTWRRI
jgi:hypothetical protein